VAGTVDANTLVRDAVVADAEAVAAIGRVAFPAWARAVIDAAVVDAIIRELHTRLDPGTSYILLVHAENHAAIAFYQHYGFVEQARVGGPTHFREHMDVEFPSDAPQVPSLVLRFTKPG
jgi:hypothetical protein